MSAICAVAKGRAIGTVAERDHGTKSKHVEEKKQSVEKNHVMQFNLELKDGLALMRKPKAGGEEALRKKFGGREYDTVRGVFEDALNSWAGHEEELNRQAFGFYEKFRPEVKRGQKGWGRKGDLDLEKVKSVIRR